MLCCWATAALRQAGVDPSPIEGQMQYCNPGYAVLHVAEAGLRLTRALYSALRGLALGTANPTPTL